jgi:CDP-glucose 4,6-dehydratase
LRIAIARAGNVIGGYDTAKDRLIPDILRAVSHDAPLQVRNQAAIRPWQHVLDCLNGYLMLIDALIGGDENIPTALNFGPDPTQMRSVGDVIGVAREIYPALTVDVLEMPAHKETANLTLNSSKAESLLGWSSSIGFQDAVSRSLRVPGIETRRDFYDEVERFLKAKT